MLADGHTDHPQPIRMGKGKSFCLSPWYNYSLCQTFEPEADGLCGGGSPFSCLV